MTLFERLRRMLHDPEVKLHRQAADNAEREVVERLARIRGTSPEEVRAAARRRAIEIEVRSYRGSR